MNWLRALSPTHIGGQIGILIVVSLVILQLLLATTFLFFRPQLLLERSSGQIATLVKLIGAAAPEARPALLAKIRQLFPYLNLALTDAPPPSADRAIADRDLLDFARRLGPEYPVRSLEPPAPKRFGHEYLIAIGLPDGTFVRTSMIARPTLPITPTEITLIGITLSLTLMGLWAARALTGPLRRLAQAAQNFTLESEVVPLPERGPYEIRVAARALNQMQARIKCLIEDRTRMLLAISHDLRTPLTRLRLRCEFIHDRATRKQILAELTHMSSMVESVLHFFWDGKKNERSGRIDLATSLQTICDQFTEVGLQVRYVGPDHVVVCAVADELHRAITNLVDNAVHHATRADVHLGVTSDTATIDIEDDGPGIPDAAKELMFHPFIRGDAARNMDDRVGFGLGLSIARSIVEAHGGVLTLHDRKPRGLVARIALPLANRPPAPVVA